MARGSGVVSFMERQRPALFVIASQIVAATMNAAAKFCETRPELIHPFMVLHIRMLITGFGCALYLLHVGSSTSVAFIGAKEVRGLIIWRAIGGVFSATGFFFSMIYLTLSEAIALSFLSPLGALILARCLSFGTLQWADCIGGIGALVGLVLVAQPEDIFRVTYSVSGASTEKKSHLKGMTFGLLGAFGGVIALASIRCIGTRAHPLTSVNMFAWSVVFASGIALVQIPKVTWSTNPLIWACLVYIGVSGFAMEYLLTVGVSKDSSSAATLMIYSQIVWALVMDRVFFYLSPNLWALLGVITIIGSLCLVTVAEERKGGIVNEHLDIENEGVELLDIDEGDF